MLIPGLLEYLGRIVGQKGEVGAVEGNEVRQIDETVCRDQGAHTDQREEQPRIHFVERLEPSPCLLKLEQCWTTLDS